MVKEEIEEVVSFVMEKIAKKGEPKKPILSIDTIIKLATPLILGVIAFTNLSNKASVTSTIVERIEMNQTEQRKENAIGMEAMKLEIQTCQTQIAVLNQQIKDLKNNQK